jgi:hypothetical protein
VNDSQVYFYITFMKALNLLKTALRSVSLLVLASLVLLRPAAAQIVPGEPFGVPPLDQFVRIASPANHATFFTPVDIPIFAYAREEGVGFADAVAYTNVEFYYAFTNNLGSRTNVLLGPGVCLNTTNPSVGPSPLSPLIPRLEPRLAALFCLVWTNAPVGSYALTAVARGIESFQPEDVVSLARTSAPVNITIIASVTNANPTDVVNISATDPIAIASTNAYWIWPGLTNAIPAWTNWPPAHWGYTTNWGPKNGLFTVRRFGNALSNLTVNYSIGGTASNGVDYVALPGSVTIPAGEGYGLIPVVPMDNHITNLAKSVVLSLRPDTNSPPTYTLGPTALPGTLPMLPPFYSWAGPSRAEVLIVDYWPRPLPWLLSDRTFHLSSTNAPDGAWFSVQSSIDLLNWTSVVTNQVVHGSIDYLDPNAPSNPGSYYRLVPLTNAPAF